MHLFLFWWYWQGGRIGKKSWRGLEPWGLWRLPRGTQQWRLQCLFARRHEELPGLLRAGVLCLVDSFSDLFWTRKSFCLGIQTLRELRMGSTGHKTESWLLKCALPTRGKETFMFPARLSSQFCHGRKGNWFKTSASLRNKDYMYLAGKTNWM